MCKLNISNWHYSEGTRIQGFIHDVQSFSFCVWIAKLKFESQ